MKIVCTSDTHGRNKTKEIPDGDVFIHAGDISIMGNLKEIVKFNDWLGELPHKHKAIISGNHDWAFYLNADTKDIITNATYLQDSSTVINGVKFYGSPWQPRFGNWAFNLKRNGKKLENKWNMIDDDTDVLITHGPPFGILDITHMGINAGCELLLDRVNNIKPKVHVFGHIHEGYGVSYKKDTIFVNASNLNGKFHNTNDPIILDI